MRNKIEISDLTGKSRPILTHLKRTLNDSMKFLRLRGKKVSISLVGDLQMKSLNRAYRGIDRVTDVLSFSQNSFHADPSHLGDILIATPTARKQARKAKKKPKEEFSMLAVHGLLHLLGYDHAKPKEAKTMFDLQNRILSRLT